MAEEFICDTRELRSFIGKVKEIAAGGPTSAEARLAAIRPLFSRLTGQLGACIDLPPLWGQLDEGNSTGTPNGLQTPCKQLPFSGGKRVLRR